MSEALANRFEHLTFETDLDDWTAWATKSDVEAALIAFLRFRPNLLHNYDRNSTEKAFASPRSWEFVSRIMAKSPPKRIEHALYAGAVGEGPAAELIGFLDVMRNLPTIDQILRAPAKAVVPDEPGALYAVSAALARKADCDNIPKVITYADRMPKEYGAYCVKDATSRDQRICDTPTFIKWAAENHDIMG